MIVIGDVHGCYKTLLTLVDKLPHRNLCFVGDLIDRGKNSKEVVDFVRNNKYKCVLGNHEYLCSSDDRILWLANGGSSTVKSYSDDITELKDFIADLPLIIEYKNFIISHSSCYYCYNQNMNSDAFIDNVLWGRHFPQKNRMPLNYKNIFGHTPVDDVVVKEHFIMIDTGCVFGYKLSAYDLETNIIYEQENIEDEE